jgi:hypothetical protein
MGSLLARISHHTFGTCHRELVELGPTVPAGGLEIVLAEAAEHVRNVGKGFLRFADGGQPRTGRGRGGRDTEPKSALASENSRQFTRENTSNFRRSFPVIEIVSMIDLLFKAIMGTFL